MRKLPVPEIGVHDVLVRVAACGVNPVDAKIARWRGFAPQMDGNWVAGLDVSGVVAGIGSAVSQWREGDRVLTHGNMIRPHGGFADYSVQDARTLIRHPDVSAELAASTPCAGWTAWRALHDRLHIKALDTLLIAGGAGGVGGFAIQLARNVGVGMIIATASAQNADYVKSLGATHVVDSRSMDVESAVHKITGGRGVSCGIDCVGGQNFEIVAKCLGFEGAMVELVDVAEPSKCPAAFMNGLSFHQLSLGSGHRNGDAGRETLVRTGSAFSHELGHTVGKIVARIG